MPAKRWLVCLCGDCGKFQVFATQGEVHFDITFELVRDEQLEAAGKYIEWLTRERDDD
jgi:hypothetical protein